MECQKANELLPGYVVDSLSPDERAQLVQHLENGCQTCQQEFEELTMAATALAESLEPLAPRPEVKQALLSRVAADQQFNEDAAKATPRTIEQPVAAQRMRRSFFPYVAASLGALVAGSLVANFFQWPMDANPQATPPLATRQWQQSLEAAEKAFGVPRARLANFAKNVAGQGFQTTIFHDHVAGQLHVLVSETPPPTAEHRLWFWLLDRAGKVLSGGQLDDLGQQRAAGVIDIIDLPEEPFEAILTNEPLGEHTQPTGSDVGRTRLERS